jgi:hypothetical protein
MTLDDLLDTLRRDILHDRSDLVSGDQDHLWSTTTLIRYIDEAQRRFARHSLCIRDGTSSVTRFTTVPYQQDYSLDPSIISVFSVRSMGNGLWVNGVYTGGAYDTSVPPVFVPFTAGTLLQHPDEADLVRGSHASRRRLDIVSNDYFDVNNLSVRPPGKPLVFETDEFNANIGGSSGGVVLSLYPRPDLTYSGNVMQMRVSRLPVAKLTPEDLTVVPEIPEDYHMDMLDYAAYLALRITDHELGDPDRAKDFAASFDANVEKARREILRKTFAPQPWGFGRNGFTYETTRGERCRQPRTRAPRSAVCRSVALSRLVFRFHNRRPKPLSPPRLLPPYRP